MNKIILFGGSFDPIHNGHVNMARNAFESLKANKVIFILSKNPRWKNPQVDAAKRLEMITLAIKDYPEFEISTFEVTHDIHYTIETARHFQKFFPNDKLYFLIGDDQVEKLHDWYEIDELACIITFMAYGRNMVNQELNVNNRQKYRVGTIDGPQNLTSSTAIREMNSIDTPRTVLEFILKERLYFAEKVQKYLSWSRYRHSCSVALLAYDIALANNLNLYQAFVAGLLHDIGKDYTKEKTEIIMKSHFKDYSDIPRFAHHQFLGNYLCREHFGITDEIIIDAISFHATGKDGMNPIGMVIYASDKIDPLRDFDSSSLIASCQKDYFEGFRDVLSANKEFLLEKKKDIANRLTVACMQEYLK